MRILLKLAALVLLSQSFAIQADNNYQIGVDGLSCPFCAYGIEKQLSKIEGVEAVKVDIGKGFVQVTTQEKIPLDQKTAESAVDKAGFSLRSFEHIQKGEDKLELK